MNEVESSTSLIRVEELNKLLESIATRVPSIIATAINSITAIKVSFLTMMMDQLDQDCFNLCSRTQPSILRNNDYAGMIAFDWQALVLEMKDRCSLLLRVLLTVMGVSEEYDKINPRLGLCYAILMQSRNHELSLVQRICTVILTEGHAKKEVLKVPQEFYFLIIIVIQYCD